MEIKYIREVTEETIDVYDFIITESGRITVYMGKKCVMQLQGSDVEKLQVIVNKAREFRKHHTKEVENESR